MKRYPEYKESGVEWIEKIPSYWQTATIKHLTKNLDGKRIPLSGEVRAEQKHIYPYYGANGVIDYVEDYIFKGEHILIGEDGAPFFDKTKEVSLLASGKFWVNNHCHILKNIGTSDARFIVHCLNSVDYFEYITGSTRDKLTQADLNRIKIPIPTYQEQTQIANFLDRKTEQIDKLIRIKERRIELLQEQRTALINQAVTKGLDPNVEMKPSGVEWIGEIPAHWEVKRLKYIADLNMGQSPPSEEYNRDQFGTAFLQGNAEFGLHHPTPKIYCPTAKKYASPDDILLSVRAPVGAINVADREYGIGRGLCAIRPRTNQLEHYYAKYLLEVVRTQLYVVATGSTYDAVTVDEVSNLTCVVPPLSEQLQIVNFLDRKTEQIDELVATEQRKIELLKEYRQSLISEAVTGKIDVRHEG